MSAANNRGSLPRNAEKGDSDVISIQLVFVAILWVKLLEMFATVISPKYALLASPCSYGHFHKPTD